METEAFTYESITVGTTAVGFTAGSVLPSGGRQAHIARVSIESAVSGSVPTMRYRYDGTDPTSSEGHEAQTGDVLSIFGTNDMRNFKAIRTGSISLVMKVTFER